jgi:hypothetical protein
MTGPSLSTNSVLRIAKARKNSSDLRPSMPAATPLSSRPDLRRGLLHALLGLLRLIDTEVVEPALDLVQRLVQLRNRNSKRAVTSHSFIVGRLPSATSWTRLPEKMCVVQIATTGPTMTATTSNGFKAAQPS